MSNISEVDTISPQPHNTKLILDQQIEQEFQTGRTTVSPMTMTLCKPPQLVHREECSGNTKVSEMQQIVAHYSAFLPQKAKKPIRHSSAPKVLAVVGSTGFLGPYIVASLLQEYPECEIVCFNRSDGGERRTISALQTIMGDISSARQRLEFFVTGIMSNVKKSHHDPIADSIPQVNELIFNAWDANWGKPLGSFECLLEGLRKVVDLLASADSFPRITFISSVCAVGNWPLRHPDRPIIPEEVVWDCGSAMPTGYGRSKCVAEQLLANAHKITKLHVNILRAGQIGGSMSAKPCPWPRQGWLYSIIRSSVKIGAFPKHVQPLDWIPVYVLAQGIANCIKRPHTSDGLQVFNMVHPHAASWNLLHEMLHTRYGIPAQSVEMPDWLGRMSQGDLKIHGFMSTRGSGRETSMLYENARAKEILPPISPIEVNLLATWLRGWGLQLRAKM